MNEGGAGSSVFRAEELANPIAKQGSAAPCLQQSRLPGSQGDASSQFSRKLTRGREAPLGAPYPSSPSLPLACLGSSSRSSLATAAPKAAGSAAGAAGHAQEALSADPAAAVYWWRSPPPLLVRCLHTSVTAAELCAAFTPFGSVRCVQLSGEFQQTSRQPVSSSKCMQTARLEQPHWRKAGRVGLLWFRHHAATREALHAAPRLFRGLPCSLHPSPATSRGGALFLLQGAHLRVGHAWRRCRQCGSVAFEAAAAAAAPAASAAAATATAEAVAAAAAAQNGFMVALRDGEEKQLRIAWAEERHAVLLELPLRALVNRVYVLAAAAADACESSSNASSSGNNNSSPNKSTSCSNARRSSSSSCSSCSSSSCSSSSCSSSCSSTATQQLQLLLCPEHAPRVTVVRVAGEDGRGLGSPEEPHACGLPAAEETANAAAALLLGEDISCVGLPWPCVRWACGAAKETGLASPLLQRLSDCRDLLLPVSLPAGCWLGMPQKQETDRHSETAALRSPPPAAVHEGWIDELRACGLLAQEASASQQQLPRLHLTQEPAGRWQHLEAVSRAVLQRDPALLANVPFGLFPFAWSPRDRTLCSPLAGCECAAAAALDAGAWSAAAAAPHPLAKGNRQHAVGLPSAEVSAVASVSSGEVSRAASADKEKRKGMAHSRQEAETGGPHHPASPSWLLWVELHELLSSGLLSPPSLFEGCCPWESLSSWGPREQAGQRPLHPTAPKPFSSPPPLPLLLADPSRNVELTQRALRRFGLEAALEGAAVPTLSAASRLQRLLQELDCGRTPEGDSSSCPQGLCHVMHIQLTPLRSICRGVFQETSNRLLRLFPSLAAEGHLVRVTAAEETGARLYTRSGRGLKTSGRAVRGSLVRRMFEGIAVGHLQFSVLGVSLGQLRKGAFWALNAVALGSFCLSRPGLFARQFGLCVSSTTATLNLQQQALEVKPDLTSACVLEEYHPPGYQPKRGQVFCFTGESTRQKLCA
ncbi:hypothetical protein Efla_001480 [Eimeria flavescens]